MSTRTKTCRAEEKRILHMAGTIETQLSGRDLDTLTMEQAKKLLATALALASAVMHEDTAIVVS